MYEKLTEYQEQNVFLIVELRNSKDADGESEFVGGHIKDIGEDYIELAVNKAVFLVFWEDVLKLSYRTDADERGDFKS